MPIDPQELRAATRPRPRPGRHRHRRGPRSLFVAVAASLTLALLVAGGPAGLARSATTALAGVLNPVHRGALPPCRIADEPAEHAGPADWDRTLLDTERRLERDHVPDDLVPTAEAGLDGGGSVRAFVILDLDALRRAAEEAGVELSVISAYRSYDAQARTFSSLERAYGRAYALESAARPGHSEHQLGTTLDLDGGDTWLADHAWEHGFVVSYPEGRSPRFTCYKPEPWHIRYVGRERAAAVHASGLSLREWLWEHADDRP